MSAAFAKSRTALGDLEAKDLLIEMFENQSRIPESDGGDPSEVVADKFAALAAENDMEDVLLEEIERHEVAAEAFDAELDAANALVAAIEAEDASLEKVKKDE